MQSTWKQFPFDEDLTGLEDMELAQRIVHSGLQVGYVAEAVVFHHHNESWSQIFHRFERESLALQKIMPHVHISLIDTLRYIVTSILNDWVCAFREKSSSFSFVGIAGYRFNQYIGSWKGNHQHRKLSRIEKEKYFYSN